MDRTIFTVIIAAITIIMAAVIGLLKFRTKSEESKKSDGNEFALIEREKEGQKNKKQNNDRDISVFNRLQKFIDSNWIQNFENKQLTYPQYVQAAVTDDLHTYWNESQKPEYAFLNQDLAEAHLVFIKAIKAFISTALRVTTYVRPGSNTSVINSKAEGYRKGEAEYDERYDKEVKIITRATKGIIHTYKRYVQVAGNEGVHLQDN